MRDIDPNRIFQKASPLELESKPTLNLWEKTILFAARFLMRKKCEKALKFDFTDAHTRIPPPKDGEKYLLYIHIPFCHTLCPYCSFNKFIFNETTAREYFSLLRQEIAFVKELGYDFVSLYVGGGTTTVLPDELAQTIDYAKSLFGIKEVTCEGDPRIDESLIEKLKGRVDRFSMGVQSFDDAILRKLGRYKKFGSSKEQKEKIALAIKNFPIVNLDFIFNIPEQSEDSVRKDMQEALALGANQISTYPLMYSPSVKKRIEKSLGALKDKDTYRMYHAILEELRGYVRLSSWSFSKEDAGVFDEYVVDYSEYVGLGSGSFSFLDGALYINTFSLKRYKESILSGNIATERFKTYTLSQRVEYRLMVEYFGGFPDIERLIEELGEESRGLILRRVKILRFLGIIAKDGTLSAFGRYFFLVMMQEFYIGMDYVRESSRASLSKSDTHL